MRHAANESLKQDFQPPPEGAEGLIVECSVLGRKVGGIKKETAGNYANLQDGIDDDRG